MKYFAGLIANLSRLRIMSFFNALSLLRAMKQHLHSILNHLKFSRSILLETEPPRQSSLECTTNRLLFSFVQEGYNTDFRAKHEFRQVRDSIKIRVRRSVHNVESKGRGFDQ